MSENKSVVKQNPVKMRTEGESRRLVKPPVDIFEDDKGVTIQADMPGVSSDRLKIEIDRDTLAIEASVEIAMPQDLEARYSETDVTDYKRSFTLGHELDGDKADANLRDGVLTLHIPKREQYQPRKIDVHVS